MKCKMQSSKKSSNGNFTHCVNKNKKLHIGTRFGDFGILNFAYVIYLKNHFSHKCLFGSQTKCFMYFSMNSEFTGW